MFSAIRARLRLSSVRARLTFWYLLTLGASLAAFATFVFVVRARTLYRELDADLELRVHEFIDEYRPVLLRLDVSQALSADAIAGGLPLIVRAAPDQTLFQSPAFPRIGWTGELVLARAAREGHRLVTVPVPDGVPLRVVTWQVPRPGAQTIAVQLAGSTSPVRKILGQLALTMALAIVLVLMVASYGSGFTARRALAPVDEIVARVRAIQASQLNERLDVRAGSDELDRLVTTLNEMLDRIEASMRGARRFAADASHELQTPIAAMRAAVETCVCDERAPQAYRDLGIDLLAEIERLAELVRDLRLLALADAGHLVDRPERLDLGLLVSDCAEIAQALADDKRIHIASLLTTGLAVNGSALHLRRAVLNVAQNAIRYAPPDSVVELALEARDGHAVVSVADQGPGIAPGDLPHIFERFYRADPARARDTGGTGLGLAIVDQIVRAHGGRVAVASELGRGSTFAIALPLAGVD